MLIQKGKQLSLYSELYHTISEKHILKLINSVISFDFVTDLLKDSYCENFGRPAKNPEMMVRILILQRLYDFSDERVIEEVRYNLVYKWFVGLNPEDMPPDPSLLSKFRTMRLMRLNTNKTVADNADKTATENEINTTADDILAAIVEQCVEKGIISADNGIAIDSTHICANTMKKIPERLMKQLAKNIFKAEEKEDYNIPNYEEIEDHNEAKRVMKECLLDAMENSTEKSKKEVEEAKEILESPLFIEQKGIRSLVDKDARVGRKSRKDNFFGYKTEFCMTTNEGIITAITVNNGAYVDGNDFEKLYQATKNAGIDVCEFFCDKAYFRKKILNSLSTDSVETYIPVSASSYRINEDLYSYNKDSDQWFCKAGNETIKSKNSAVNKRGKPYQVCKYYFEREQCRNCPHREECIGKARTIGKVLEVSADTPELYEYSQRTKQPEFWKDTKSVRRLKAKTQR